MTKLAALTSIQVSPNRQRKEFKEADLRDLGDSVQNEKIGLLHPIVLRIVGENYFLVAGERRLRVFRDSEELGVTCFHEGKAIPKGFIPYISLGDLDPVDAWQAELEENIIRTDLTWAERAAAVAGLMSLRQAQASRAGSSFSVKDLTKEIHGEKVSDQNLGARQSDVRKQLILSRHLGDKDIIAAPSLREAYKVLERKERAQRQQELGAALGVSFTAASHSLINDDCVNWLRLYTADLKNPRFDVILTDPPYGIDADTFGDAGGQAIGPHGYSDSAEDAMKRMAILPRLIYAAAKPQAHAYIFCDLDWFSDWKAAMSGAGWKVFRTPLIWYKPTAYRAPWPDQGPQRKYEAILYAVKGDRPVMKMAGDVLAYATDKNLGHAAQKPVELFVDLLARSTNPGDSVLDPYCGSGPIFPAAHLLKVFATGVELDQAAYGMAAQRIKELP